MKPISSLLNRIILLFVSPIILLTIWIIYFKIKPLPSQLFFHFLPPLLSLTISIFLALSILFLLNFFNSKFSILSKDSFSILLFSLYFIPHHNSQLIIQLISCLFLILILFQILNSTEKTIKYASFFNAGFIIGLISIFNPPFIIFFLLVIISLIIFKAHNWRNWLLPFLGLFIPFFLFIAFSSIFSFNLSFLNHLKIDLSIINITKLTNSSILFFSIYLLLITYSIINILWNLSQQKIKIRSISLFYFALFFVSSIGFILFQEQKNFFFWTSLFSSLTLILSNLKSKKNKIFLISIVFISFLLPIVYYFG